MVNEPEIQAFLARVHRELDEIKEKTTVLQNRKRELEEMVRKCEAVFGTMTPERCSCLAYGTTRSPLAPKTY